MLADAYAVRTSAVFSTTRKELEVPQVDEGITRLLNEYIALRPDPNGVLEQCSLEDLVDMASFYLGVAQPLLLEVPRRMFSKLEGAPALGALTGTERIRFLRALYRFQVFQNLFGACREPGSRFTEVKILAEFFGTFEPWEVEEVNCVHKLVWDTYDAVLGEIAWDVNKDNPRFGERSDSVTPPGAFDLEQHSCKLVPLLELFPRNQHCSTIHDTKADFSLCPPGRRLNDAAQRELLHDGTVGRGLVPFHKVLRTPDHDDLVTLMQQTMTPCRGEAIDNCLRWATQYRRRSAQLSEADRREASWEKLPFSEDKEDGPPLAWVEIWTGTFSNSYGDVIPPPMHDWGYVFWDKRRLVQSGGKRELKRMWTDLWLGQDPRVEL